MKNQGSVPTASIKQDSDTTAQSTHRQRKSVIQVATDLVDSVTKMLCRQITAGNLGVKQEQQHLNMRSQSIEIENKTIDIDEHKRKIRKFMKMNKVLKRQRQMRSLEMSEKSMKLQEESLREREDSKVKAAQERKKQIEKRMEAKKSMLKEIQRSVLESNIKFNSVKKKKFLYQEKEEEYYKKFILPKIQEQKNILQNKKSMRKPIDMTDLYKHELHYEEMKVNERLNRSITVRMIKEKDREYSPPEFIPESFRKFKEEQDLKREEEIMRKRQMEVNEIRKKQYSRRIDETRAHQRELSRALSPSPPKPELKEKVKPKLERQEVKNIGNSYLKDILKNNKRFASTTKKLKNTQQQFEAPRRKVRSEYQIQIVKEERVQKIQKIRTRKIDSIVNDKSMDSYTKMEKLRNQIQKLDEAASHKLKQNDDIQTVNESACIMMNSIHAKLALLGCTSSR